MVKSNRVKTVFMLVLIVSTFIFGQDKQDKQDIQLREEILAAFKSGGEQGLLDFVKKNKDKISSKFIVDFAEAGSKERKVEWLNACKIMAEEKKDEKTLADVLYNTGRYFSLISDFKKASDYFDKVLPIYLKLNDPVGQGNVYFRKGVTYSRIGDSRIGDNSRAFEMYNKALPFFEKAGDLIGQGNVYMGKGVIYSRVGDISRALEIYNKALLFFEKAGDLIGQGNVYYFKGDIYYITGNKSRALEMFDKALPFFEKAGEPIGQGNVYMSKGTIYLHDDEHTRALEMLDKAMPFFEKAGHLKGQGSIYQRKGEIYFRVGEHTRALKMIDKALPFFEKAGEPVGQGKVYYGKGFFYSHRRKKSRTIKMLDKALLFYKKAGHIGAESTALYGKAAFLGQLGKKEEAVYIFEEGIAKLERMRTQTAFSEMKKTFMEKVYEQYEETVLFMLENKYNDKGFKYAESIRARVFLDQMAEGLVRLDKGLTPGLQEKRDKLVTKLSNISKEMHQTAGGKDEKKLGKLKDQYRKVEREFEDLLVKIRLSNPLYASVRYPKPITVRTLQKEVLKKDELLLRYFISPYKLYVFIISKESFKVVPIKVKENEIKSMVKRYLLAVKENNSREIGRYGKSLYKKLFKPLEKTIVGDNNIIIIPDGELAQIPFESLIIDKKKSGRPLYLIERYRPKYAQSASLLSILRKHYHRDKETNSFIGFGDPVYDYENFKQGKPEQGTITRSPEKQDEIRGIHRSRYARAGGIMNRLPRSGEEVNSIRQLFKNSAQKWIVHSREQASEDKAKALEMRDFDYIHFACHGLFSDDFQSLVLSQLPPEKSPEDGYFTLNEIMNCDYNAKLVVLSACQTGTGKMERAEGVTGLTRAVMYAGTPAVVASLWKVDDKATKELMVKFYKNILEQNLDKTQALRQAKLELLKTPKYSSPLFWSAFVLYGE